MISVYISDQLVGPGFSEMKQWAEEHCKSFSTMNIVDVSDVSLYYDYVAEFTFTDERDETLFTMRWS
jgi:hypothetical protein